jgi:alpha-ribazole phosphatase/probable phosphoglycerate mutase
MNDLLFIRHAETDMAGTFCGQSDPPVNAAGYRQIQELIEGLRSEPIEAVYSSDLQRAVATARALAGHLAIPCITRSALREIDFGKWEGLTWSQVEERDLYYATLWLDTFPKLPAPDGESLEIFEARVRDEIHYLLSQSRNRKIAVVTHAGVLRTILRDLCCIDEKDAWALTQSYCCTFRYDHAGGRSPEVLR